MATVKRQLKEKVVGGYDVIHLETSGDQIIEDSTHRLITDTERTSWNGREVATNKKTTLADNSDTFYPSQKAVKTAVDAKANIAQEAWIEPTLLNGWVEFDNAGEYSNIKYFKDSIGFVHLHGLLKSGSASTAAFQLPTGYRPASGDIAYFATADGWSVSQKGYIVSDGNVVPAENAYNVYMVMTGISFKAEA